MPRGDSFRTGRSLYLRALGVVQLCAFGSAAMQVDGLIGSGGILPVAPYFELIRSRLGPGGWLEYPSLLWFDGSDARLHLLLAAGLVAAGLLVLGVAERASLLALWALYLSLAVAGRTFFSFQWDTLLLEATACAVFLGRTWLSVARERRAPPPSRPAIALSWLLLFKLVFSSGLVKWKSGDETWRSLDALRHHYETQPLPTWVGWYAHQLPASLQRASVAGVFFIQLVMPIAIFLPRRFRLTAAGALGGLQLLIAATGNYGFFNLLALALCLLLVDDLTFRRLRLGLRRVARCSGAPRWAPRPRARPSMGRERPGARCGPGRRQVWRAAVELLALAPFVALNGLVLLRTVAGDEALSERGEQILALAAPIRTINHYGLFAVMTTVRREIVIEGSDDGTTWRPYALPYQPGDVDRAPGFVAPHMPRLDWQMWFAALGTARQNAWFRAFLARLLEGAPAVRALLARDPFPRHPPRFVRARLYRYHFMDIETRRRTGAWWRRTLDGEYFPAVALDGSRPPGEPR